jgi:hypothetical protein
MIADSFFTLAALASPKLAHPEGSIDKSQF